MPEEKEGFIKYIKLHKQLCPLLYSGNGVRFDSDDEAHLAHGVISKDQEQGPCK